MEAVIIVLLVALLGLAGGAVWLLAGRRPAQAAEAQRMEQQLVALKGDLTQTLNGAQQTLMAQMNAVDAKLNQRLDAVQTTMGQSLTATTETIGKIGEQLGGLNESAKQMLAVGRDISSLQDILQPPKVRGGFGELLLERLLAQILPDEHYTTQYRFRNGAQVDAVIRLGGGLAPVDSKFPLESFNRMQLAKTDEERAAMRREFVRAVRTHIDAVAKYIQPEEGTFPFALMYIPAENVFYEIIVKDDLLEGRGNLSAYALEQRVIPVSPSSFYAYLQAILLGLRGMRVEERAHEMIRHLEQLSGEFGKFRQELDVLGSHVGRAKNKYDEVDRLAERLGGRLATSLGEPDQDSLSGPAEPAQAAQPSLLEPVAVNGSDEGG